MSDRPKPTADDSTALDRTLRDLRELDRGELERVSTELTMTAAALSRERLPDRAAALILLARVAYVVAHEGLRG